MKFDILKATELASIAAYQLIGSGNKNAIDEIAVNTMRLHLNNIDFCGKIVLNEGVKDNAPCFGKDELVGTKRLERTSSLGSVGEFVNIPYTHEVILDAVDGTTQCAFSGAEAASIIAVGQQNSFRVNDSYYMMKLAGGPRLYEVKLDITDDLSRTIYLAARALNKRVNDLVVCVLNRPRHTKIIEELRGFGVKLKLINDCDCLAAVATCFPESGLDLLYGIGGNTEGVLSAAAIKCLGGFFQCYYCDKDGNKTTGAILDTNTLIKGDVLFCATAILNGMLLRGIRYVPGGYITHSLMTDSAAKSLQRIETFHWVS